MTGEQFKEIKELLQIGNDLKASSSNGDFYFFWTLMVAVAFFVYFASRVETIVDLLQNCN